MSVDHRFVFGTLAALLALLILRAMSRWNADEANPFQMRDLVMENGRASKGGVVLMGAFVTTTWLLVYYALAGKLTEGYFGIYCTAWIAPVIARVLGSQPQPQPPAAAVVDESRK